MPYKEALATVAMPTLHERSIACGKLFGTIANDPNHKLYDLLPDFNNGSGRSLRHERVFNFPIGARLIGFPTLLLLPLPEILNANFLSSNTLYYNCI
jgi:hypothetical protein